MDDGRLVGYASRPIKATMKFFPEIKNTCSVTGVFCNGVWAKNEDEARAGVGVCEAVAKDIMGSNQIVAMSAQTITKSSPKLGTVADVLAKVESGRLSIDEALELERRGKNRITLISKLEAMHYG